MLSSGPQPQNHADRLVLVQQLSDKLQLLYPDQVVAIALYGSMARQQDGPYSDIEMLCIVTEADLDVSFEWVYGAGKAEINVLGRNDARWEAK
ncbi:MAG: nucleotidyltransferase domain-containing protein, partial [Anaerolineales bacterium]|nr:nucleotidyltransferase domain-containing protein [Anaerolineales bacterium]